MQSLSSWHIFLITYEQSEQHLYVQRGRRHGLIVGTVSAAGFGTGFGAGFRTAGFGTTGFGTASAAGFST